MRRRQARASPGVCVRVGCERPQRRGCHPHRAVGVTARSAPLDLAEPALHPPERVTLRPRGCQLAEVIGDRRQPEHARPALLGALAGQVAQDPRRVGEPAARRRQYVQNAAPGAPPTDRNPAAVNGSGATSLISCQVPK